MNRSRQKQGNYKGCLDPNRAPYGQGRSPLRELSNPMSQLEVN
jgi:hypothetical protein